MSDFAFRPGGSLKLKGDDSSKKYVTLSAFCTTSKARVLTLHIHRKKKKSKAKEQLTGKETIPSKAITERLLAKDDGAGSGGSGRDSPVAGGSSTPRTADTGAPPKKEQTDAEKRFEEIQKRRVRKRPVLFHGGSQRSLTIFRLSSSPRR